MTDSSQYSRDEETAYRHDENENHQKHMHEMCTHYHLYFVQLQMMDGSMHEGIIDEADEESVTLLMPEEDQHNYPEEQSRQFGVGGFGGGFGPGYGSWGWGGPSPGYGFGPGYGYGVPRRFRRFRRRRFPFYGIGGFYFPFFF